MNQHLKYLIKVYCIKYGILRTIYNVASHKILILGYHSIKNDPSKYNDTYGAANIHSAEVFNEQMEVISKHFNPITMDDLEKYLIGEGVLPPRPIIVTFDDGFIDNYEIAIPILNLHAIKASFYLTVGAIENGLAPWYYVLRKMFFETRKEIWHDKNEERSWKLIGDQERKNAFLHASMKCAKLTGEKQYIYLKHIESALEVKESFSDQIMMNWDQAGTLIQHGHIIGAHTMTHPNLAYVGKDVLYKEMLESKNIIEKRLCINIKHFSYPHPILDPHWTEQTVYASKEIGYRTALTTMAGAVKKGDNPLKLCRIGTQKHKNKADFIWKIECAFLGIIV